MVGVEKVLEERKSGYYDDVWSERLVRVVGVEVVFLKQTLRSCDCPDCAVELHWMTDWTTFDESEALERWAL